MRNHTWCSLMTSFMLTVLAGRRFESSSQTTFKVFDLTTTLLLGVASVSIDEVETDTGVGVRLLFFVGWTSGFVGSGLTTTLVDSGTVFSESFCFDVSQFEVGLSVVEICNKLLVDRLNRLTNGVVDDGLSTRARFPVDMGGVGSGRFTGLKGNWENKYIFTNKKG